MKLAWPLAALALLSLGGAAGGCRSYELPEFPPLCGTDAEPCPPPATTAEETTAAATTFEPAETSVAPSSETESGTGTTGQTDGAAATSRGAGTEEGSSAGEQPVCGNGVLEDFGALPEECDDGNLDAEDGCDASCARDIRVFVSSKTFKAAELGGLYTADAQCLGMANAAGLTAGESRFQAWLSDSDTDARDWLTPGRGRLVLVNGLMFAASWEALLTGELERPLDVTELSTTYHGSVWTGTQPDGTAVPDSSHCADWTSISGLPENTAYYGESYLSTVEWTISASKFSNPAVCNAPLAIYCFEEFL